MMTEWKKTATAIIFPGSLRSCDKHENISCRPLGSLNNGALVKLHQIILNVEASRYASRSFTALPPNENHQLAERAQTNLSSLSPLQNTALYPCSSDRKSCEWLSQDNRYLRQGKLGSCICRTQCPAIGLYVSKHKRRLQFRGRWSIFISWRFTRTISTICLILTQTPTLSQVFIWKPFM